MEHRIRFKRRDQQKNASVTLARPSLDKWSLVIRLRRGTVATQNQEKQ